MSPSNWAISVIAWPSARYGSGVRVFPFQCSWNAPTCGSGRAAPENQQLLGPAHVAASMARYDVERNASDAYESITSSLPELPMPNRQSVLSSSGGGFPFESGACPGRPSEIVQNSLGPAHAMRPSLAPHTSASSCQLSPLYSQTPAGTVLPLPAVMSTPLLGAQNSMSPIAPRP